MKTLLIIDDQVELAESLRDILEDTFESIICLNDGKQALEYIKLSKPNMIISDVQMPRLNGIELITNLKALGIDIPVVLMTAGGDKEMMLKAIRLGVSDFLEKPFTEEVLVETIDKIKEISKRKDHIKELESKMGTNDPAVIHEKKMLGLLEAVNSKKTAS